jgi:hypothetical protein
MSSSRSRSDTILNTTQTSENLNVQDVDGITVAGVDGGVSIVQTDHNAIGSAHDLAQRSVDAAESISRDSMAFAAGLTDSSIGSISRGFERYAEGVGNAYENAFSGVSGAVQRTQDTVGAAVDAILSIGKEQNTSADQRIADISTQAQRNLLVMVGIFGAVVIAYTLYKGR